MGFPDVGLFVLVVAGLWLREFGLKTAAVFVILWVAGMLLVLGGIVPRQYPFIATCLLDIVLILKIFGGDIRLFQD